MTQTNRLYDNRTQMVADFLKQHIQPNDKLSIVSAYFTIYAYEALRPQLDHIDSLRFLFGEPRFVQSLDPDKDTAPPFELTQDGLKLTQLLQQKKTARDCAAWIEKKVEIRSIKKSNLLHGKLYHILQPGKQHALLGSSNLTRSGLGLGAAPNLELNLAIRDPHDLYHLQAWFDEVWQSRDVEDVKPKVLAYLEKLYEDHPPQLIYFKTLFEILYEDLQRTKEADDTRQTGLQDTAIWNALFPFQKDGAIAAIRKINTYRGCILADSVGLGKTFTALAVIKYFLLRNQSVLLLCPKRLKENWGRYLAHNNSKDNPLLSDQFSFTLLSHTDLSRTSGKVGDLYLEKLNWGNYDLVVIDESHNFRNDTRPTRRKPDGSTPSQDAPPSRSRYEKLLRDIIQDGIPSKVLLLSATPVNNNLTDLHNQLRLLTADNDRALHASLGVASLQQTIQRAQRAFLQWSQPHHSQPQQAQTLVDALPASFFHLLDQITIARSRKHILRYYSESLKDIGLFPARLSPLSFFPKIDSQERFPSFEAIDLSFRQLHLALYRPFTYLLPQFAALYLDDGEKLSRRIQREAHLTHLLRISFLKRLESSVYAFARSLRRFLQHLQAFISTLEQAQSHPSDPLHSPPPSSEEADDDDDEATRKTIQRGTFHGSTAHLDVSRWLSDLRQDALALQSLHRLAEEITPSRDSKLQQLQEIIQKKALAKEVFPDQKPRRKLLVFSSSAETVAYLYQNLHGWARQTLGIHSALVTGSNENASTLGQSDYETILTDFSPRSKRGSSIPPQTPPPKTKQTPAKHSPTPPQTPEQEIDLLFATDCISEGQNLQDCDTVVNYDIHWNPVRLIQRFGRIDRLKSTNPYVQMINFWPTPDLEHYIKLQGRVEARMILADLSASAADNILQDDEIRQAASEEINYRDQQLLRLQNETLDLEDLSQDSPSLADFSLEDFRRELLAFLEANRKKLQALPLGLYAVVPAPQDHPLISPGAIFCLKQKSGTPRSNRVQPNQDERHNPLAPYFLVYVRDNGKLCLNYTSVKHTLDIFRDLCIDQTKAYSALCDLFQENTQRGQDMSLYNHLLTQAAREIAGKVQEKNLHSLFQKGGKLAKQDDLPKDLEHFELITWLVLL